MKKLLFLLFLPPQLFACLWDSDTIRDEIKLRPSIYDLISGQLPRHGKAYYEQRKKILEGRDPVKAPLSLNEKIDLGVTYTRLELFEPAEQLFLELLEQYPNKYELNSNIGVLYKKRGEFDKSFEYLQKALRIKPSGHMGLGDWYLRRVAYELRPHSKDSEAKNFIGESYYDQHAMIPSKKMSKKETVRHINLLGNMIINDRHFPDTYVVLGDLLRSIGDLNLAARAYGKAISLGHHHEELILSRLRVMVVHFVEDRKTAANNPESLLPMCKKFLSQYDEEFIKADQWIIEFWAAEEMILKSGKFPSLNETEKSMKGKKYYPSQ